MQHRCHRPGTWVHDLVRLVEPLDEEARGRVLGQNVAEIYQLT